MEEKKNNKGLIWLIVILIILVLGLVGYIVYDIVLKVDKTNLTPNNTSTTTTSKKIIEEQNFTKYPEKNDDNIVNFNLHELYVNENVNLMENFKNLKLKKGNIDYTLNCTKYDEAHVEAFGYACSHFEILINKVKLEDYFNEGCGHTKHIIINGDYLILQLSTGCDEGCGYIKIFKNGELIYTVKGTTSYLDLNDSFDNIIKYSNNKLYYFIQTKETDVAYNVLKMIDFNKSEIIEEELERKETDYAVCYDLSGEFE
ncbi:MAG: hypothetical protein IJD92_03000 [Bacilli bacterium]|nr:hypothetical protein [Bacilli bacterium]